jgi:hypothetical protein
MYISIKGTVLYLCISMIDTLPPIKLARGHSGERTDETNDLEQSCPFYCYLQRIPL